MSGKIGGQFLALDCVSFSDLDEFHQYRLDNATLLGTRWMHERSFASHRQELLFEGTCGVCLRPATFTAATAGGEVVGTGRIPNWRDALVCDCERHLASRDRGVLQFLLGNIGLQPWYRVLILGNAGSFATVLKTFAARVTTELPHAIGMRPQTTRLGRAAYYHLVVALENLQAVAAPFDLLQDAAEALLPGGRLVFTAPFHADSARSDFVEPGGSSGTEHKLGWDILQHAKDAGFRTAAAQLYWSEEFGYLGSPNLIFSAAR